MAILLAIDDTDNTTSRGTGYLARRLGDSLAASDLAIPLAITRHQLLVHPRIRYTSRNSAVCLVLDAPADTGPTIRQFAIAHLTENSAPGSSAGLGLAREDRVAEDVQRFGLAAKRQVVDRKAAAELADAVGISLDPATGGGEGVIGALAALGLHRSGEDGRYVWLPHLRQLAGKYSVGELRDSLQVQIATAAGEIPPSETNIEIGDWVRPIMRGGQPLMLVEKESTGGQSEWRLVGKSTVKSLSN